MSNGETSGSTQVAAGDLLVERYWVGRRVARGGMAAIYRATDRRSGGPVAVKALYEHYAKKPVVRARFLDEGRIQSHLDHPNIIDVYAVVERPALSIVMEYIDGPSLEDYLAELGPFEVDELLELLLPVLSALGFAHQRGVIHRDIKPSNILLKSTPAGMVPKIMDFGVAKVERGQDLTAAGTTVGTLHYMSPEQIVGADDIDGRADIYSLGVTLYKLCTGALPFHASTEFALMMAQVEARPTPPSTLHAGVSDGLEAVILRALSKDPSQRYQSVKALTGALIDLVDDAGSYADTDTNTAPIAADLLEYAMMADEVAVDRTHEMDMAQIEVLTDRSDTERDRAPLDNKPEATTQLNLAQIKEQLRKDRDDAGPNDPDADDSTIPMEQVTTTQLKAVDSRETTQPFENALATSEDAQTRDWSPVNHDRPSSRADTGSGPNVDSKAITRPRRAGTDVAAPATKPASSSDVDGSQRSFWGRRAVWITAGILGLVSLAAALAWLVFG